MELRALISLRAVLDELIRNRMHADSGCVEPLMFHRFQYGAAEAAADQMLLDRDEPRSHSERLFEQIQIERLCEACIDHSAVDAARSERSGRLHRGRNRGAVGE